VKYLVVIEKAEGNYSAYAPDLPGCIAVGNTVDECAASIQEAIEFHIRGLHQDGIEVPQPTSILREVVVHAS
jgi:predicted RNase H-like HicB family nuclease